MRYIGSKAGLLDELTQILSTHCPRAHSVIDIFAGSGVVTQRLKKEGYLVTGNDCLYFSYCILRGTSGISKMPDFSKLVPLGIDDPIDYLNHLTLTQSGIDLKSCFIYQNYTTTDTCSRMYFQPENALKIDLVRQTIGQWKDKGHIDEDGYYYLLAALLEAVPYVANIAGVYAAYLKYWEHRSFQPLTLKAPEIISSSAACPMYNEDVDELLPKLSADVLYSDSPYNTREYLPNYHLLETIARYDNPVIYGVTGMREHKGQRSAFCSKKTVKAAFERMISEANVRYIVISYNNEGLISTKELTALCRKYALPGSLDVIQIPYRRYKSRIPNESEGLLEQIYVFEKKGKEEETPKIHYLKSPMNYVGGKYRVLSQLIPLFPEKIDTFVDLFAGGLDVAVNVNAKKTIVNDVNSFLIEIYEAFQKEKPEKVLAKIDTIIDTWHLSKENREGYLALRAHYNESTERDPIELYVLMCYSFNYQLRFNNAHAFNNPFGRGRSSFNDAMRRNMEAFLPKIADFEFHSQDFRTLDLSMLKKGDFIYCDPPYTITTGYYNDGKRGFSGWSKKDDLALFDFLRELDRRGVKFALSNVLVHKGVENEPLKDFAKDFHLHRIWRSYANASYHAKSTLSRTVEVLVTNYPDNSTGNRSDD